jgi:anhydro-N-acetylmuramic acid kinase
MLTPKAMVVAGVMSGTSADGVDVALVRVSAGTAGIPKLKVLGHSEFAYPKAVREAVLRAAGGEMKVAELSRLNWRLGEVYAGCLEKACAAAGVKMVGLRPILHPAAKSAARMGHPRLGLVGMHGQTIYHEAPVATWQIGEAAVVRERVGVPVVSDFRPADMAAGGQGAPLVPMLDYCLFRSKTRNRVLLNLGGIANMTAIPASAGLEDVIAFDSGPANMVIDALMQREFEKAFDRGGKVGTRGKVMAGVVEKVMGWGYFSLGAPKSCGREQFGAEFVSRFSEACEGSREDRVATAVELTAHSIYEAYTRICWPHLGVKAPVAKGTDLIVAGGGVRNAALMGRLREMFSGLGVKVSVAEGAQAKEAMAFALLGWLSWHEMAGNVPAATGARGARVLGKISYV